MKEIFKCPVCGKEFNSRGSLGSHIGNHVKKGEYSRKSKLNSSNESFLHKVDESGKIIEYICKCGRSFTNKQSYCSHCSHCEIKTGRKDKGRGSNIQDWWNRLKYEDPDKFHELHSKAGKAAVESNVIKYGDNPLVIFSKTPSKEKDEAYKKQSETRKRKYLNGELTPAEGIGRGYGSYYNNIFIRSSYEMIYVVYLYLNNLEFKYESIRVKYNDKVFISDFEVNDKLIEVKGKTGSISLIKSAFESNGYNISFITHKRIIEIKDQLRGEVLIDELLTLLTKVHREFKNHRLLWTIDKDKNILYNIIHKDNIDKSHIHYEYVLRKEAV